MPARSTRVRPGKWLQAFMAQQMGPRAMRRRIPRDQLDIATRPVAPPARLSVPTRHGWVRCLVFAPHPDAPLAGGDGGPPVNLQIHGGAFMIKAPWQDDHINRYVASDVGAVVVNPDYSVAPQARYPVAEEQCFDIATWLVKNGPARGWDTSRLAVGGTSAGGKLAINVVQQARVAGGLPLRAITLGCSVVDMVDLKLTSPIDKPYVTPQMQEIVRGTYFVDAARRGEPLASPLRDPHLADGMPPALIMTGGYDVLGPEMDALAGQLAAADVVVAHRRYPESDHGFGHFPPVGVAHDALRLIGAHLLRYLA